MDILPSHEALSQWLLTYGSITLFVLLAVGIIALPVPEETLMVIAGILMQNDKLPIIPTVLAAIGGSLCGITTSYFLGRTVGHFFLLKYGSWFGLTQEKLGKAHSWFEKYGKWTLFFGYFIPGVRHFSGLSAGLTELSYKDFATYAYSGAVIWVGIFLSFGYFFGNYWVSSFDTLEVSIEDFIIGAIILLLIYFGYKEIKRRRKTK